MRGNRRLRGRAAVDDGSIPACAGEPGASRSGHSLDTLGQTAGLSPRVRGNPLRGGAGDAAAGSIPACAGEPARSGRPGWHPTVYPRVCGGTFKGFIEPAHKRGLSPRVRGNPGEAPPSALCGGSIPACAGEPLGAPLFTSTPRVYPRVCGGTAEIAGRQIAHQGLSPRVRGNRAPSASAIAS